MKNFRLWFPVAALAALMAAGCVLVSGQFLVTFEFDDPLTITSPTQLAGVAVNLNDIGDYNDHKDKLKDVADLALLGKITNLSGTATTVEVWMVASPGGALLTTDAAVRGAGQKVWGTMNLGANGVLQLDWDTSSALFVGRQALIDQIKGDGRFDLYALGAGANYTFRIEKGALVAVLAAAG
jgi:hypothetical protein